MNTERLLNNLEKVYGKNPVKADALNRREALPSEIEKALNQNRDNGQKPPSLGESGRFP